MAVIVSPNWSKIRNSIAGITYLSGPGNPIIARQRVWPVNPNTVYQSSVKSSMVAAIMNWENMSEDDRELWAIYAATCGEFMTGRQAFIRSYTFAYYSELRGMVGLASGTDPPTLSGLYNIEVGEAKAPGNPGTGFDISITNWETIAGAAIHYICGPFNTARYKYKGPFPGSAMALLPLPGVTSTLLTYDGLVEGGVYFVRLRAATAAPPTRLSSTYIIRGVAQTNPGP